MDRVTIREIGNSQGIIITKDKLKIFAADVGTVLGTNVESGKLELYIIVDQQKGCEPNAKC